jgi:GT2 family glycosyltransferase
MSAEAAASPVKTARVDDRKTKERGEGDRVVAVIVTYGDRRRLLEQVLDGVLSEGVARAVVVDNAATWDVASTLTTRYGGSVDVIGMGSNTGPAKGFAVGIVRALDLGANYILLLDDDNRPRPGMVQELLTTFRTQSRVTPLDLLALVPLRPGCYPGVEYLLAGEGSPRPDSFRGLHILDAHLRLWRRTPWGRPRPPGTMPELIELQVACFGGLFFHRDLVARIGLPNGAFVIYGDDTEYTFRIRQAGGRILLATRAGLDDLEPSWVRRAPRPLPLAWYVLGQDDVRAYYITRNGAYFDANYLQRRPLIFRINLLAFVALLRLLAIVYRRTSRYRLLRRAIRDGLAGRLGTHEAYRL